MVDVGNVLDARFRLVRMISRNESSSTAVYEAEDMENGRRVAVKVVHEPDGIGARFIRNEICALGRLDHPNVVTMFAAGKPDEECPYFVMELLSGKNLREHLRETEALLVQRRGWLSRPRPPEPLPIRKALHTAGGICAGLRAVHDAGVIHADLCTRGVFPAADSVNGSQTKIIDFGLSHIDGVPPVPEEPYIIWGKLCYLSPEQMMRERLDGRSDLYNVGLILFEMLTGSVALPQDTAELATNAPRSRLDPRPPLEGTSAPPALVALTHRLLAFERDDRPASAQEVEQALAAIERELPP